MKKIGEMTKKERRRESDIVNDSVLSQVKLVHNFIHSFSEIYFNFPLYAYAYASKLVYDRNFVQITTFLNVCYMSYSRNLPSFYHRNIIT